MHSTNHVKSLVLIAMFASLMAVGANLTSMLVIAGVPITLQTFFAILAGTLLGSKRGATAMILYMVIGLIGFPVFSQFHAGLSVLLRPTFGFILSFIVVAYVAGKIIEKSNKKSLQTFMYASLLGLVINYIIGTNYMYFAFQFLAATDAIPYSAAWLVMLAPAIKDIIFTCMAAILAKRIYETVQTKQHPMKQTITP
ncbi:biotin transporter BioY [Alkalihalobacillus pseudalcaliphilus]|uniref:biotin transporter BioY n=1 Tax=Alkalihalobacillus pseudalcaliphilus TaxID=79884 RepID=UPI00064DF181|nr:biotin transporter BioY [Alkalihalobacillus pseudalcaliphilus]KMK77682.1 biotin biosynthesis protein BioC [Alkalihalobacillus pseudalcaliphilus]